MLEFEHVLVEFLLQFLVRVVDTKLLKGVFGKMLKAVNIKNTNKRHDPVKNLICCETTVNFVHEPIEQAGVDELRN